MRRFVVGIIILLAAFVLIRTYASVSQSMENPGGVGVELSDPLR